MRIERRNVVVDEKGELIAILEPSESAGVCDACGKEGHVRAFRVRMLNGAQDGIVCSLSCGMGYTETAD